MNSYGLKSKLEVGIQWGVGDDASIKQLESAGTRDSRWLMQRAQKFLDAGAHVSISHSSDDHDRIRRHY